MTLGTVVGTLLIVALTIAIGVYADRKLAPRPEQLATPPQPRGHALGEAPSTAIRAGAPQLEKLRASQRCKDCRAALGGDGPDEEIRYADRRLIVIHLVCPACGRKRSLYVAPISG